MTISGESLLIILVVGLVAGWLAGQIVQGTGFGAMGDLIIGVIGAFIGAFIMVGTFMLVGVFSLFGMPAFERELRGAFVMRLSRVS